MHITYTYKVLFFLLMYEGIILTIILKQRHKYHFQMLSWLNCDFSSYNHSTCIQNNKQFWNNKTIKILCDLYPKCSSIMSTCYWKNYRNFFFFFKSQYFIYPSFQLLFESYLSVHKHQINHLVAIMRVLITAISLSTTLAFRVSVPAM